MAEPLAYEGTGYEVVEEEPPEVLGRNLVSASYLLAGATAFFFVAFVFAYFYLRSLNSAGMWKPHTRRRLHRVGHRGRRLLRVERGPRAARPHRPPRRSGGGSGGRKAPAHLLVGVIGLVLQVIAWTHQSFGPADGGFASVYFGWTAFLFLFVFCTLLWLEMTFATSLRYRKMETGAPPPGHASGDPHRDAHDIRDPLSLVRAELVGLSFYWTFLAGIAVISWIILYLI